MHVDSLTQHERTYCEANFQQPEKGTFQLPEEPREEQAALEVSRSQLSPILHGIDLTSAHQRRRFPVPRELLRREEAASY